MKRVFLAGLVYCLVSLSAFAQNNSGGNLTLQQCVETAINNNLNVQQSDLQSQAAEINWKQAKLDLLPDLNGSISHGINQGRSIDPFTNGYINQNVNVASYGLGSGVTLFNGLSLQNTIKQTRFSYEASKMSLQQQKDNITIGVIVRYLQVLNNQEILDQVLNQTDLTKKQVERLDILNNEGAIAPSLLYDLKGQYAGDQISYVNAKNAVETAKLALCQLMNIPYDKNFSVEKIDISTLGGKYEDSPERVYQVAMEQFALIKSVDYSRQSAAMGVKVARGRLFPVLSLNANFNTNYSNAATSSTFLNTTDFTSSDYVVVNGTQSPVIKKQNNFLVEGISYGDQLKNNRYSNINLSLRIPIFNSLQQRNRIKLAKLDLKNAEVVEQATKTQLQQDIEQAYLDMTGAYERFDVLKEQEIAFNESFRAAEIRFNAGVGNSIDYLTAKNNLDRSRINLIISKYEYVLRTKVLDYYKGEKLW